MTTNDDSGSTAARRSTTTDPYLVEVPVEAPLDVTTARTTSGTATSGSATSGTAMSGSAADAGRQVAGTAKEQAKDVAGTAKEQAASVAGIAQEQAQNVLGEAKDQAGDLLEDLRRQLSEQSDAVRDRLSEFFSAAGTELADMAGAGGGSGYATQVVRQVGDRASAWGSHLQGRESGDLLQQTRAFARRRPGTFLLGALAVGVLAGRVGRGAKAQHDERTDTAPAPAGLTAPVTPAPVSPVPVTPVPVTGTLGGLDSPAGAPGVGGRHVDPYATATDPDAGRGWTGLDEVGEPRR